jgi:hypothetical protein
MGGGLVKCIEHDPAQFRGPKWFDEVSIGARRFSAIQIGSIRTSCQHDDRQAVEGTFGTCELQHFPAGDVRETDVKDEDVGWSRGHFRTCLFSRSDGMHVELELTEANFNEAAYDMRIIYHKHPMHLKTPYRI